ncbi:oxidoreductase-like domain-containing protein [Bordetella tumulicola]|uniref:oxidoreductase-like domain-containing protein n=1 Tax=Bordetella tumulicola TaxID=1649133 RepID=UPI0039F0458D
MAVDDPVLPTAPVDDPEPIPPIAPEPYECCQSGCDPCIYDLYNDEMDKYREQLRAWRARHSAA